MTRRLEELFDLPQTHTISSSEMLAVDIPITKQEIAQIDADIDKIDAALKEVSDVDKSDSELDEIANLAKKSFEDLSDLGMNVDSRFASEIFAVAGTMLGHALTAKTAKMNKKLKMIDLQMKKLKMDRDIQSEDGPSETAQGQVLNRNDLLERLLASRGQNNKSS